MLSLELEIYVKDVLVFTYIREPENFTLDDVDIELREKDLRKNIDNIIDEK